MSRARYPQRELGEAIESLVLEGSALAPGDRFDATVARTIDGRALPPAWRLGTALVEAGTDVEIKAAQRRVAAGSRGRWLLRQAQHERLLAAAGCYALAVYDAGHPHDLLAVALVPATVVDELVGSWTTIDADRVEDAVAKLAWSRVLHPEVVAGAP